MQSVSFKIKKKLYTFVICMCIEIPIDWVDFGFEIAYIFAVSTIFSINLYKSCNVVGNRSICMCMFTGCILTCNIICRENCCLTPISLVTFSHTFSEERSGSER